MGLDKFFGRERGGAYRDERRIDAVEQLVFVPAGAGISLTHLAMASAIAHPGVTSALLGRRTSSTAS